MDLWYPSTLLTAVLSLLLLQIGTYNPVPYALDGVKEVSLQVDRVKYWLSVGAQPSERVSYLLWRAGLVPAPPIHMTPTKWLTKKPDAGGAAGGAGAGGAADGKKKFHTMTSTLASSPRLASSFAYQVVVRPVLASFSGIMTRPAKVFGR